MNEMNGLMPWKAKDISRRSINYVNVVMGWGEVKGTVRTSCTRETI